jgi:hypothetical protein
MPKKTEKPAPKSRRFYRPGLVAIAAMLFWAAVNEPPSLSAGKAIAWLLEALAAGLLVRAALAVAEPLLKLLANAYQHAAARARAQAGEP